MKAIREFINNHDDLSELDIAHQLELEFKRFGAKNLSFKSIVFESTSEKDEYYALKFFDYLFELESIDATKNKMTHLQFSNDEYYKFFDYLFTIADIPDFQDGLRNVIATYEAQNLNVFPAKVEGGIVVSNGTQVAPPQFKVVDIK